MLVMFPEQSFHCDLGDHEQHQNHRPEQDLYCVVVPESNKKYDAKYRQQILIASQRNIQITDEPMIESFMPHSPKFLKPIIIEHAPSHIFNGIDPVHKGP